MATFREILTSTESRLESSELHFGHGYFDAHDEAVALVLAAEGFDPLTGSEILDSDMSQAGQIKLQAFLQERIHNRLPTAYIIGYAALGELTFRCDSRAMVTVLGLAKKPRKGSSMSVVVAGVWVCLRRTTRQSLKF